MQVHSTAIVHKSACLEEGVVIGPYVVIEEDVCIKAGASIGSHTVVGKNTTVGANCQIFPHVIIGLPPQDMSYKGEKTSLTIGENTIIREFATVHRGTVRGGGNTVVGPNCMIMAYAHVAHDCKLGTNVILANAATLAGHIIVEDHAIIGGLTPVHQHVHIGTYAMVGGGSGVPKDVIPYAMASGNRVQIHGVNVIGLKRHGFSNETIHNLRHAYKLLFNSHLNTTQALEAITEQIKDCPPVDNIVNFIKNSKRGICKHRVGKSHAGNTDSSDF